MISNRCLVDCKGQRRTTRQVWGNKKTLKAHQWTTEAYDSGRWEKHCQAWLVNFCCDIQLVVSDFHSELCHEFRLVVIYSWHTSSLIDYASVWPLYMDLLITRRVTKHIPSWTGFLHAIHLTQMTSAVTSWATASAWFCHVNMAVHIIFSELEKRSLPLHLTQGCVLGPLL